MKEFTIYQETPFGTFKVVEWEAESAEQAVAEFIELNPAYANGKRGAIVAR